MGRRGGEKREQAVRNWQRTAAPTRNETPAQTHIHNPTLHPRGGKYPWEGLTWHRTTPQSTQRFTKPYGSRAGHPRASEAPKSSQLLSSFCAFRPQGSSALQLQVLLQLRLRGITPLIHHPYRNNRGFFSSLFQLSCRSGDVRFSSTEHSRLKSHPENGKNSTPTWDNSKEAAEVLELSEDQQPATAHGGEESNTNSQHSGSSGWQRPAGGAAHHRDPQQLSGSPFGAPRGNLRRVLCL